MSFSVRKYCFFCALKILTATGCSFTNPFHTTPYLEIKKVFLVKKKKGRKKLFRSTHFPSPIIEIGFRLSTLYKFEEYPGPDGESGDASGWAFVFVRHDTKNTMTMTKSIIAVDAKLTQTAGFLSTDPWMGSGRGGGTTIGEVRGTT